MGIKIVNGLIEHEDDVALNETIENSTPAFESDFLNIDAVDITLANGKKRVHQVLRHPGAVGIVALNNKGEILLVRQYRTALERVTVEIPAGKIDLGESPEDAARRELSEETGYSAKKCERLGTFATAAGYSDELIHLFMATDLKAGKPHLDEDEFVSAEWVPLQVLINSVLDARIEDSKTAIAALLMDSLQHILVDINRLEE